MRPHHLAPAVHPRFREPRLRPLGAAQSDEQGLPGIPVTPRRNRDVYGCSRCGHEWDTLAEFDAHLSECGGGK